MDQTQTNPSRSPDFSQLNQDQGFISQIKAEMAEFSTAFSNLDLMTAASFFTADATLINPVGVRAQGRDQIAQVMKDDLNTLLKGGRSEFSYESSRMISSDLAFVDLLMNVRGVKTPDGQERDMPLHVATVMRKEGNRWLMLECRPYSFLQAPSVAVH